MNHFPIPKDLLVFVTTVNKGSLHAAAEELRQTPAFVTKRIQQLESQLNNKLLHRSSRGITLTEVGTTVFYKAQEILEQYKSLMDDVSLIKVQPKGQIRIGCSFGFGRSYIAPAITELMALYPDLLIHFELFDRQIDLAQDNIDLDIRVNDDIPQDCIVKLLAKNRRVLCASPEYLQLRGTPSSLADLQNHDCLITKERDHVAGIWELRNAEHSKTVKISGYLSSNSGEIIMQWALQGKGIMLRSLWDIQAQLDNNKLVQVLPEYYQSANIWAVYRTPLFSSAKLRVCVEFFTHYCQKQNGY
jgi:DNA-binding transcriptional LysR family regulator